MKGIFCFLMTAFIVLGTTATDAQTKVYVHKKDLTSVEYNIADIDSISFTPRETFDYSIIKINEVSGPGEDSEKFYELINIGTTPINLEGFTLWYNANSSTGQPLPTGDGNLTWTGCEDQVIEPGELLTLLGRSNPCSFTTGLTGQRNLIITLKDPNGNVIDKCIRAQDTEEYAITDKSYSRIPDGTGPFYFTVPTPDEKHGSDATGLVLVPQTQGPQVKINEVSGPGDDADKFYELINIGLTPINLEGFTLYYNANGSTGQPLPTGDGNLTWTGCEDQVIAPGELLTLLGRSNPCSFTTGLTGQRNLIITLKDPDGNVIDQCIRAQDTGEYAITDKSYSRIPDGTGPFYFAVPTPDEMNGSDATGLILVPQTQ